MMPRRMPWILPLALCLVMAGAAGGQPPNPPVPEARAQFGQPDAGRRILVRSSTDIDLFAQVLTDFTAANPAIGVDYEQWGTNDLFAISQADCRAGQAAEAGGGAATGAAAADLVISSAVDQQVRLVNDGCARAHLSPEGAAIPDALRWRDELFGITREPAVMVYNRDLVPRSEAPRTRFDLIELLRAEDSRYAGKVATYDIETSGLGYLFAFMDSRQATSFGSLIEAFARTGAISTCCSAEIIDGVASGDYLLAYNVLGSYALARAQEAGNLVVVAPQDYTLVLARAALIPKQARDPISAGLLLDFLLSEAGQHAMARARLYLEVADGAASGLDVPAANKSVLRLIELSPVLLVGTDQQKKAQFLDLWRNTFAAPPASQTPPAAAAGPQPDGASAGE